MTSKLPGFCELISGFWIIFGLAKIGFGICVVSSFFFLENHGKSKVAELLLSAALSYAKTNLQEVFDDQTF